MGTRAGGRSRTVRFKMLHDGERLIKTVDLVPFRHHVAVAVASELMTGNAQFRPLITDLSSRTGDFEEHRSCKPVSQVTK